MFATVISSHTFHVKASRQPLKILMTFFFHFGNLAMKDYQFPTVWDDRSISVGATKEWDFGSPRLSARLGYTGGDWIEQTVLFVHCVCMSSNQGCECEMNDWVRLFVRMQVWSGTMLKWFSGEEGEAGAAVSIPVFQSSTHQWMTFGLL